MEQDTTVEFVYRLEDAIRGFKALLPHVANKDEQLSAIYTVAVNEDGRRWSATDRFTLALFEPESLHTMEMAETGGLEELPAAAPATCDKKFLIPREGVEFASRINVKKLRGYSRVSGSENFYLRIAFEPGPTEFRGSVKLEVLYWADGKIEHAVSQSYDWSPTLDYPPVERLVPEVEAQPTQADPQHSKFAWERMIAMVTSAKVFNEPLELRLNGDKAGRVDIGDQFVGVIMPIRKN